jgi:hypothetical protein
MSTLTNRTIRSTYDQLIQLEDQLFQDGFGTSSLNGSYHLTGSQYISGNLYINGTASIDYLVSSYESSSIIYSSGSTKFGDTLDDTHEFTGSVTITGSAYSEYWSGSFSGSFFGLIDSASNAERAVSASQADDATTASIADKATNLSLNVEDSSASPHYIIFGANTTGETGPKTDGNFSYIPNTETLTVTKVIGQLEGSASYAETASLLLGSVENAINAQTASLALSTSVTFETSTSFAASGDGPFTGSFSSSFYSFFSGSATASVLGTFTGSLLGNVVGDLTGTASIADFATTASHALSIQSGLTASHANRADSASIADEAVTSSFSSTGDGLFSGSFSGSFDGAFTGDGTLLTGSYTVANPSNNRVITSVDSVNGNAETNLTFDGTTLTVVGNINTGQGTTEIYLMNQNVRTTDAVSFTSITETSAERYKENIKTLDSGNIIHNLRPVTFDWKSTGERDYGLIAEEVNEHLPELVKKSEEGEVEGIKYTKLTSLLIKAVQDQQHQIELLTKRIGWLENHV